MRNLNKLGLIFGGGGMAALVFSLAACGDDPEPGGGAGTGGSTAGSSSGSGGSTAGSSSGSGGAGGSKAGAGGGGAGGAGGSKAGAGGGGAGGMSGGGAGGAAGGGAGGGGSGGGGGAPSAACTKLCMGADSIVTVCAGEAAIDANLKMSPTCLQRCAKETDMTKVACWQTHTTNYKNEQGMHCQHAGGKSVCMPWPAL